MHIRTYSKPLLGASLLVGVLGLVWYGAMMGYSVDLAMLKMYRADIETLLMENYLAGVLIFAICYTAAVALSLPIASALTVLAGFLFGTVVGTLIVSVVATAGATIALLINRFFFVEFVAEKYARLLRPVNAELARAGMRDIFLVRLTPLFPFSLVTIAASLTRMRVRDFVLGTFFGILPFTYIYVQAGTRLSEVERFSDILSFPVLCAVSLIVIAVSIPLVMSKRRPRKVDEHDTL